MRIFEYEGGCCMPRPSPGRAQFRPQLRKQHPRRRRGPDGRSPRPAGGLSGAMPADCAGGGRCLDDWAAPVEQRHRYRRAGPVGVGPGYGYEDRTDIPYSLPFGDIAAQDGAGLHFFVPVGGTAGGRTDFTVAGEPIDHMLAAVLLGAAARSHAQIARTFSAFDLPVLRSWPTS